MGQLVGDQVHSRLFLCRNLRQTQRYGSGVDVA